MNLSELDIITSLICKKLTSALTEEEGRRLRQWLDADPHNRTIMDLLEEDGFIGREYSRIKNINADKALADMQRRIKALEGKDRMPRHMKPKALWAYCCAAAVAAVVIIGAAWYGLGSRTAAPHVSQEVKQAMQQCRASLREEAVTTELDACSIRVLPEKERIVLGNNGDEHAVAKARCVTTAEAKEYWLTLADGTIVHLNSKSRLVYPVRFSGISRDVYLEGEAYFMVAKDRKHPFIVHTRNGEIKEYGTEFNVSTYKEAGSTSVVLVEGSISVTPHGGGETMMRPGDELRIKDSRVEISKVDTEPYVAWNTGKFAFHDEPLSKIMEILGHWYGFKAEFVSSASSGMKVSGIFDRYDNLQSVIGAIEAATGLEINIESDKIIINR